MVMSSDFIQEDVELDGDWTPKRGAGHSRGGRFRPPSANRVAEFLSALMAMLMAVFFVLARLALLLLILYVACTSLHKHGGFRDFCAWLCVAAYAFGRIKAQILGRVERDRRNAANL